MSEELKIKAMLYQFLNYEEGLNDKLDMLTAITITTRSEIVARASEEIRNEIVEHQEIQDRISVASGRDTEWETIRTMHDD